jgi:hypothetical protein
MMLVLALAGELKQILGVFLLRKTLNEPYDADGV